MTILMEFNKELQNNFILTMKMAKKRIKTGPPQWSLNTNATPLVYFSHLGFSRQNRDTLRDRSRSSF